MIYLKVDAVTRALAEYHKKLHAVAQASVMAGTEAAEAAAKGVIRSTTVRHTGALEDSWTSSWRAPYKRGIFNYAKHSKWMDEGTRPHTIPRFGPRFAKALRFVSGGQVFFRKAVGPIRHPGTRARSFMPVAFAVGERMMGHEAQRGLDRIAREF